MFAILPRQKALQILLQILSIVNSVREAFISLSGFARVRIDDVMNNFSCFGFSSLSTEQRSSRRSLIHFILNRLLNKSRKKSRVPIKNTEEKKKS